MQAHFERFTIIMTKRQAESASHPGPCDADVQVLLSDKRIRRQLGKISDTDLADELRRYGAWDEEQLSSRRDNEERIVWIAAGDIVEL
jgi:hypothetical protein